MSIKDKVCIVGVGLTDYGARGQFAHRSQIELIGGALDEALEEAGLNRQDVDGFSSFSNDANDPSFLAPALGIPNVNYSAMVFGGGGGGGCAAIANAAAAVAAGYAEVVMVYKIITQPPHRRSSGVPSSRTFMKLYDALGRAQRMRTGSWPARRHTWAASAPPQHHR